MGCCPSKNNVGVINLVQVKPAKESDRRSSRPSNIDNDEKTSLDASAKFASCQQEQSPQKPARKARGNEVDDKWFANEFMVESSKTIAAVKRMGFSNTYFDARQKSTDRFKSMQKPKVEKGQLWSDNSFSRNIKKDDDDVNDVTWKRPHEICKDPQLFVGTTDRFCVNQGGAGTCWFNAILAPLADQKEIFNELLTKDATGLGTAEYDGTFHCKLWRLGQWFDVYIDDVLPTTWNGPWGAHSIRDNEMWVPLMEKAFTKFFGDYVKIYGGPSTRAYSTMTGGCHQTLHMNKSDPGDEKNLVSEVEMFQRIETALKKGFVLATSMDKEEKRAKYDPSLRGLVSDHCYTINGAMTVNHKSKKVNLIRMRNPWGRHNHKGQNGEWTGPWSDSSNEWKEVDKNIKEKCNFVAKDDGEFWINFNDFSKFFHDVSFCGPFPEFNKNYEVDKRLTHILNILGEWQLKKFEKNLALPEKQKFIIRIPAKGADNDGKHHVIMELLKEEKDTKKNEKDETSFYSPLSVYRVADMDLQNDGKWIILEEIVSSHTHRKATTSSYSSVIYDHRLTPGLYIVMPTYYPEQIKVTAVRSFCIRIFSAIPEVECRQFVGRPNVFSWSDLYLKDEPHIRMELLDDYEYVNHTFGQLAATGGSENTLRRSKENIFILEVPSKGTNTDGRVDVLVQLLQQQLQWPEVNNVSLMLDVYKVDANGINDSKTWYCLRKLTSGIVYPPSNPDKVSYYTSQEICHRYCLEPGLYALHPSLYSEINYELKCCLRVQSRLPVTCKKWSSDSTVFLSNNTLGLHEKPTSVMLAHADYIVGQFEKGKGGYQTMELVQNQKIMIDVLNTKKDEFQDVIIQLFQQQFSFPQFQKNSPSIALNIYQVDETLEREQSEWICLKDIPQSIVFPNPGSTTYFGRPEICHKYSLQSGRYVVLPSLFAKSNRSQAFCVAFRSSYKLSLRMITKNQHIFIRESESIINVSGGTFELDSHQVQFGAWIKDQNAGGQIDNRSTFASNPQYCITISGNKPSPVLIDLLQETIEPVHAIVCYVMKIDDESDLPASFSFLNTHWSHSRKDIVTGRTVYMRSIESSGYYMLEPGQYVAILVTEKPNQEKKYALFTAAPKQAKMNIRSCN